MKKWIISLLVVLTATGWIYVSNAKSRANAYEDSIRKVLLDDEFIYESVHKGRPLKEFLEGLNPEDRSSYIRNMKRMSLRGCPKGFIVAYSEHIKAWESHDQKLIRSTWIDVVSTARIHGVDWKNRY